MINFEEEVILSPDFQFWDRGDGIGEISNFNSIIGYINGGQQIIPEDYFHYDPILEQYVADDKTLSPISCFPGTLNSQHESLKSFNSFSIDCIEHLFYLVNSIPSELLPLKPKGSVIDIFSQKEKFLISEDFNFDIIKNGIEISSLIVNNFNSFSSYFKNYFFDYPEISIEFLQHSYLNGNIYFLYQINQKYFLHLVFNSNNKIIMGEINKSRKMNEIIILDCIEKNYLFICQDILEKLKISSDEALITICLTQESIKNIPRGKSKFLNELIDNNLEGFIFKISHSSIFILQRNIKNQSTEEYLISIDRIKLKIIRDHIAIFNLTLTDFISLLINDYFNQNTY